MGNFKTTKIISIWVNQDDGPSITGEPDERVQLPRDLDAQSLAHEMTLAESSSWHYDAVTGKTIVTSDNFEECIDVPNAWFQVTLLIEGDVTRNIEEIVS